MDGIKEEGQVGCNSTSVLPPPDRITELGMDGADGKKESLLSIGNGMGNDTPGSDREAGGEDGIGLATGRLKKGWAIPSNEDIVSICIPPVGEGGIIPEESFSLR